MELFGDVLFEEGTEISNENLIKLINHPFLKPRFRISVLNQDESISYVIPPSDIPENGISYTEEYQNGARRSITLELINKDGKYSPSINGIWLSTKFRFDIGLETKGNILWFPRGIYIMGDVSLTHNDSDSTVSIQLKDKFAMFEGKLGTLEEAYEIEANSDIYGAINGILNSSMGNGYIYDYKSVILDPSFYNFRTKATIRIEEGGSISDLIDAIATQLSAEYYYNNIGNLCFYPINETIDDSNKPIIWVFDHLYREPHNMSLNYKNEDVINVVKVVGDNVSYGIYSAVVTNENPSSPICIQQIGRRVAPKYTEANVWSNDIAESLANYYLRQASFLSVDFSCEVAFNPVLAVNNIIEVDDEFTSLRRDKLLLTSISYNSESGLMSLKLCNTADLPSTFK